jgi:hypothetical protein
MSEKSRGKWEEERGKDLNREPSAVALRAVADKREIHGQAGQQSDF